MTSENTKVSQVKINRSQIEDLIAMHISALGKAPDADLQIIEVTGFYPKAEMLTIRYKKRKEVKS